MGSEGGSQGSRPEGCSRAPSVRNVPEACGQRRPQSPGDAGSGWVGTRLLGLPLPGSPARLWPRPCSPAPRRRAVTPFLPGPALGHLQWVRSSGGVCRRVLRTGQVQGEGPGRAPCMQRAGGERGCRQGWPPRELSRGRPNGPPFTPGRKRVGRTSHRKPTSEEWVREGRWLVSTQAESSGRPLVPSPAGVSLQGPRGGVTRAAPSPCSRCPGPCGEECRDQIPACRPGLL